MNLSNQVREHCVCFPPLVTFFLTPFLTFVVPFVLAIVEVVVVVGSATE